MKPNYCYLASHLKPAVETESRREVVCNARRILGRSGLRIDLLVATGISGTVFGTSLADAMGLPLAIVRKDEHPAAHSSERVEGPDTDQPETMHWVFVDDLISTGATLNRVREHMTRKYGSNQKLVGIYLYCEACETTLNWARVDVPVYDHNGLFFREKKWKDDLNALAPVQQTLVEVPSPAISANPEFYKL